jgi:hypothetical protein
MNGMKERLRNLTKKDILVAMKTTMKNGFILFKNKLNDYGLDTYKTVGAIGIYLRMKEKFNRVENLLQSKLEPNCESIEDNLQDIWVLGATLMAMMEYKVADPREMQKQYQAILGEEQVTI